MAQKYPVLVREDGQVTLPADVHDRLGLKSGDVLDIIDTPEGLLMTSQGLAVTRALDGMGAVLCAEGATLENFIESAREARPALIKELYGLDTALVSVEGVVTAVTSEGDRPRFTLTRKDGPAISCYFDAARHLDHVDGVRGHTVLVTGQITRTERGTPSSVTDIRATRQLEQTPLPRVGDIIGIEPDLTGDQTTDAWLKDRSEGDDSPRNEAPAHKAN